MKISVIIPIYNVELYLERCVKSVLHQTYADIEIIMVEDCSTDQSKRIAIQLKEENSANREIKLVEHAENRGLSAARNSGMKESSGELIFFLDSDDDLPTDALENLIAPFEEHPELDMIFGEFKQIGAEKYQTSALKKDSGKTFSGSQVFRKFLKQEWPGMACNVLIRKSVVEENQLLFKEGIVHEDTLWSYKLFQKVNQVVCINQETYNYYLKEGSITTSKKRKNYDSILFIVREIINLLQRDKELQQISEHSDFLSDIGFYFFKEMKHSTLTNEERQFFVKEMGALTRKQLEIFPKQTIKQRLKRMPYLLPYAYSEQLLKLF